MYTRLWDQATGLPKMGIAVSTDGGVTFPKGFQPYGMNWQQPDCEGTMRVVPAPFSSSAGRSAAAATPCFALTAPFGTARANMTLSHSCGDIPGVDAFEPFNYQHLFREIC